MCLNFCNFLLILSPFCMQLTKTGFNKLLKLKYVTQAKLFVINIYYSLIIYLRNKLHFLASVSFGTNVIEAVYLENTRISLTTIWNHG